MPLLITFKDTCDASCQLDTMKEANIGKSNYSQTSLGIIFLNGFTDEQLTSLRGKTESIVAIECDGTVSTTEVPLENCDDNMRMPLLITFKDTCDASCQLDTMKEANIGKSNYSQTSLGIITLNEVTDEQLMSLRGKTESIVAIECYRPVAKLELTLQNCGNSRKMPLLFYFMDACKSACQLEIMQGANIDKTKFNQTSLGIIMLNEVTDEQLKALLDKSENIASIECSSEVSTDDIPLDKCDDTMRMPLLISFMDTCNAACQLETMQEANVDKTKFGETTLGIIMLNEVTDEQLKALRRKSRTITAIECDSDASSSSDANETNLSFWTKVIITTISGIFLLFSF